MSDNPITRDRWPLYATGAVVGILIIAIALGLFVVPVAQGMRSGLTPWVAICRAVGLSAGSAAARQPTGTATAHPVSDVAWTAEILARLSGAKRDNGKRIAMEVCSVCHGEGGISTDPAYPMLAGQSAAAIYKQLHDYRNGARVHPLMTPVAEQLSEGELADVAAYFGGNNLNLSLGHYQLSGDEVGNQLILRGDASRQLPACNSCHGNRVGGPIETPTLAGQSQAYLLSQVTAFADGKRRNDLFARMRTIAGKLTPEEREGVTRSYQGVQ